MAQPRLRVYYGPAVDSEPAGRKLETVTLPLGEILPLLAEAANSHRTWLADFGDDPMTISTDLYEMILAYQHFRRPSA